MDKKEYALQVKKNGNNCAQAVLLAFGEELGRPEDELRKIGAGLGLGMGCMEGTCGALSAAEIILGMMEYDGKSVYSDASAIHKRFTELCHASICREIKGRDTGKVLCSCEDCVRNAAGIVDEFIMKKR